MAHDTTAMTSTTNSTTNSATESAGNSTAATRGAVWRFGGTAILIGAAAAAVYGWLLDIAGIPMLAGSPGADTAEKVGPLTFAAGTAMLTAIATVLAVVLTGRAQRPKRTFVLTCAGLTLVSLVLPVAAGATATSTKVMFTVGHLVLAALIVPIIARPLPDRR